MKKSKNYSMVMVDNDEEFEAGWCSAVFVRSSTSSCAGAEFSWVVCDWFVGCKKEKSQQLLINFKLCVRCLNYRKIEKSL